MASTNEIDAKVAHGANAGALGAFGPSSCALGPHATATLDAKHLCKASFVSATVGFERSDSINPHAREVETNRSIVRTRPSLRSSPRA